METLGALWKTVEQRCQQSVFTSWHWISAWLETDGQDNKFLLVARMDQQPVGLAIWCHTKRLGQHQYWLHKSGNASIDQIWIEYNDFLVQEESSDLIKAAMWAAWFAFTPRNSKYFVGASQAEAFIEPRKRARFDHLTWTAQSYLVPLTGTRTSLTPADDQHLLRFMSANTRSQLKRSMQYFKTEYGDLTLRFAQADEAIVLFDQAATWHNERWGQDGKSGFNNPSFVAFHHLLISRAYADQTIDVVELRAGERSLGVFYNFVWQNKAYFYLSSLNYQENNHARPGLVGHFLLGRHYLAAGRLSYDLLGGGRYKARFSVGGAELEARVFYTRGLVNALEVFLRKVKMAITRKNPVHS